MIKRFLIVTLFALIPMSALAEDVAPADTSVSSPAPSSTMAPVDGLGPSSSSPAGGSSTDVGSLQQAGLSPLQSTEQDSDGLTAPNQQTLQQPASSDQALEVLRDEADGAPRQATEAGINYWVWLGFILLFGAIAAVAYWLWSRRARSTRGRRTNPFEPSTADAPPSGALAQTDTNTDVSSSGDQPGITTPTPATPDAETAIDAPAAADHTPVPDTAPEAAAAEPTSDATPAAAPAPASPATDKPRPHRKRGRGRRR